MPRVAFVAILTLCIVARSPRVHAQTSSADSTARQTPATLGFLTSYRFHVNALRRVASDDNFVWDADFGGDIDVVDLKDIRSNLLLNFESIVGQQIRAIDPNQGNYTFDISVWWRSLIPDAELGVTLHHVSRHLFDRDKRFAIAWNMLGFQYTSPLQIRSWDVDIGYRLLKTFNRSFVDYTAEVGGSVQALRVVHPRVSLVLGGELTLVSVDKAQYGRDRQVGGRFEVAARFPGGDAVGEVFIGWERRIDADPLNLAATTFTMLGFRFLR